MIAPPWYELPPRGYGGIESVCADLTDGLVSRGVDVTLVGPGANGTQARFVQTLDRPQHERLGDPMPDALHAAAVSSIVERLHVDLVHDHSLLGPLVAAGHPIPTLVTAHGPAQGEMGRYYHAISPFVRLAAISDAQRRSAPSLPWAGTVHNAIRVAEFPFRASKASFALFLGRMSPDKGLVNAMWAANEAGIDLVVAAKATEPAEQRYFEAEVKPRLDGRVHWVGEAGRDEKRALLSAARCLLFPIDWEEPFGMVMIEALACGTPVVALDRGSVPEIIRHGTTGLICASRDDLPDALLRVHDLNPADCREDAQQRFDVSRMAAEYEQVYCRILDECAGERAAPLADDDATRMGLSLARRVPEQPRPPAEQSDATALASRLSRAR